MTNIKDIYWLAGLIEGEGCFTKTSQTYPVVAIKMTDQDVVERALRILKPTRFRKNGNKALTYAHGGGLGDKRPFIATICGRRAAGWMMTLYPLMGERRKARIRDLLRTWRDTPSPGSGNYTRAV